MMDVIFAALTEMMRSVNGGDAARYARLYAPGGLILEERRYLDSLTPMAQLGALGPGPSRALPALPSEMKPHASQGTASEAANVALVRAAFAALDAKKQAEFLASLAPDAVIDEMIEPQPFSGRSGVAAWYERWTSAVPDARTEITALLAAGDAILVEAVVRGTLRGPLGGC